MNLTKKLSFMALALALTLLFASTPANAQQVYRATFDLPFEAQFGTTIVEPGQYSVVVERLGGQKLIRLRGQADLAVLLGTSTAEDVRDDGRLIFVSLNGVPTLKKFEAGAIGQSFVFPLFKAKGERASLKSMSSPDLIVATR